MKVFNAVLVFALLAAPLAQAQVVTGERGAAELRSLDISLQNSLEYLTRSKDVSAEEINALTQRINQLRDRITNLQTVVNGGNVCNGAAPQCP